MSNSADILKFGFKSFEKKLLIPGIQCSFAKASKLAPLHLENIVVDTGNFKKH